MTRKLLLTGIVIFALVMTGCSSSDDEDPKLQEIWLGGYTAFTPDSEHEYNSVKYIFFKADNNEKFKTESKTFDGTISEYQELNDEVFSMLEEDKTMLEDGTVVSAYETGIDTDITDTYGSVFLPLGRYYVYAIYQGSKDGYKWLYSTKYTGKYYDVKERSNPWVMTVVFPCDRERYGYTEWVEVGDKFSYDFTF